jgi:hypothetical protein
MISDYSSVTLDYLILNKPVIYLNSLAEDYSKTRGMILEDNYEITMPGIKVVTYKDLERELIENLETDKYKQEREKSLPLVHKYCDNKSAERVYEKMMQVANAAETSVDAGRGRVFSSCKMISVFTFLFLPLFRLLIKLFDLQGIFNNSRHIWEQNCVFVMTQ